MNNCFNWQEAIKNAPLQITYDSDLKLFLVVSYLPLLFKFPKLIHFKAIHKTSLMWNNFPFSLKNNKVMHRISCWKQLFPLTFKHLKCWWFIDNSITFKWKSSPFTIKDQLLYFCSERVTNVFSLFRMASLGVTSH